MKSRWTDSNLDLLERVTALQDGELIGKEDQKAIVARNPLMQHLSTHQTVESQ